MWKEAVSVFFKFLPRHLARETENNEKVGPRSYRIGNMRDVIGNWIPSHPVCLHPSSLTVTTFCIWSWGKAFWRILQPSIRYFIIQRCDCWLQGTGSWSGQCVSRPAPTLSPRPPQTALISRSQEHRYISSVYFSLCFTDCDVALSLATKCSVPSPHAMLYTGCKELIRHFETFIVSSHSSVLCVPERQLMPWGGPA
jgi:hypothetical protein